MLLAILNPLRLLLSSVPMTRTMTGMNNHQNATTATKMGNNNNGRC
jgi:hypothetical protein